MNFHRNTRQQAGFTIVELVVVILLLGILAATALPRFIDVTDDAHEAAFNGVVSGFSTGVALYQAQWVADGESNSAITEFNSLFPDEDNGYPVGDGTTGTADNTLDAHSECLQIFNGILQGGRPSIVHAADSTNLTGGNEATDGTAESPTGDRRAEAATEGYDYIATFTDNDSTTGEVCTYEYLGDPSVELSTTSPRSFTYNALTGEVSEL